MFKTLNKAYGYKNFIFFNLNIINNNISLPLILLTFVILKSFIIIVLIILILE
jgi:hypothetical protein